MLVRDSAIDLPLIEVVVRNEESHLEGLLLIEARVAVAGVVGGQVLLVEPLAAAHALGDGVAGELEVHAAQVAALLLVDGEGLLQLAEDVVEAARLDAAADGARVAVHGVALPDDGAAVLAALDGANVRGEELAHLGGAVARDEGHLADLAGRVNGAQQLEQVRDGRRGADLDADGVGDAAEELDVRVVNLARAVADPDEMRRGVVVLVLLRLALGRVAGHRQQPGQALLVLEEEALVARVNVHGLEVAGLVGANGAHEAQGLGQEADRLRVLGLELVVLDVAELPVHGPVQVSNAGRDGGSDAVQRCCRVAVSPG